MLAREDATRTSPSAAAQMGRYVKSSPPIDPDVP